jgi:hypothetical protein
MGEFSGYDVLLATGAAVETSSVERKTETVQEKTTPAAPVTPNNIRQSSFTNVLNKYRSYTYNFTLAALKKDDVNFPERYRNSALDLVILKSGGKGTRGITANYINNQVVANSAPDTVSSSRGRGSDSFAARDPRRIDLSENQKNQELRNLGQELIDGFNKNSPGRFDLYIDNVEIETIMAFNKEGGTTLPTAIRFRVTEPYSINGFIEALHVSALAAGYNNYVQASFILKMEFIGYPDNDNESFKSAEIIEKTTRYFPIGFTGIEVDVGEEGTVYKCAAVPYNDKIFGNINVLKRSIPVSGKKIHEVLENLAKGINEQIKSDDQKSKTGQTIRDYNEYEIKFPVLTAGGYDKEKINLIGNSVITADFMNSDIFKFPKPGTIKEDISPSVNNPPQIQFSEGQNISEIIAAVIRDSEYIKTLLKEPPDESGFVKYFAIKSEIINKAEIDPVTRQPFQKFVYHVIPHNVHFTRIPTYGGEKFDSSKLELLSLREYNYIYTGENIDIINFKLNFNTLFFEAIPVALGNNDQPGGRTGATRSGLPDVKKTAENITEQSRDEIPTGSVKSVDVPIVKEGGNGSQRQDDPYYALARNFHSAMLNSTSMISGELEILGDPLFVVTGGIGNYNPKLESNLGQTIDGEANYLNREVLITINFRNPIDINPLEKGGMFYFESEKLPFSGVYRVTTVKSTFNNGIFKQRLDIIRIPGQIIGNVKSTNLEKLFVSTPKKNDITQPDTTLGENRQGIRPNDATNLESLGRGLPSPGLPGILSNFIGAIGGLGGQASGLLTQVSGAISRGIGSLAGSNSVFGGSIPGGIDQLASGIRLQASGLLTTAQSSLNSAASIVGAAKTLQSSFSISDAAGSLSSTIIEKSTAIGNLIGVPGSGIGEGASIKIDKQLTPIVQQLTENVNVAATDLIKTTAELPTSIAPITGQLNSIGNAAVATVTSLGNQASALISGVGDKITSLTAGIPTDPTALAAKFGINASQLSGLSPNLQSKVLAQMENLSKQIPEDTDLTLATARGLKLEHIPADKLGNIPATAPIVQAPKPEVDQAFLAEIIKTGGPQALANAFGVSDIKKISTDLLPTESIQSLVNQASSEIKNALTGISGNVNIADISSLQGKLSGASGLLNNVSNIKGSVESNLSSIVSKVGSVTPNIGNLTNSVSSKFGSISSGQSPLDKLFDEG